MKIGWQRILSMVFLITALVLFTAMHFLPLWESSEDYRGWMQWIGVWQTIRHPERFGLVGAATSLFSFLTFSLLIVASPFLGSVWAKSLLAWSMLVIFSGVAAAGFWVIFKEAWAGSRMGGWCLMISPVLNFVGLLLARPQWLKKSGPSFPPESQAAG